MHALLEICVHDTTPQTEESETGIN